MCIKVSLKIMFNLQTYFRTRHFEELNLKRMNKNKKIVIIAFIVFGMFSFSSCQFALKTFYGIKKPKVETEKSLTKYLKRKDVKNSNIYAVSFEDYVEIIKQVKGIPEIMIFSADGKNIKYKEEGQCNGYAFGFVETLSSKDTLQFVDSLYLDNYLRKLKDFSGKQIEFKKQSGTDFYLFIYWARYTGRLNKDHVKIWEEQANNNQNSKIEVIKVNLDEQEWWKTDLEIKNK